MWFIRRSLSFQGVFSARSEVEATRPHNACARQTVRRLVALGFHLDVLKKSFQSDTNYDIPTSVFLQDMTEVQKLRVHRQTDQIRKLIKQFFARSWGSHPVTTHSTFRQLPILRNQFYDHRIPVPRHIQILLLNLHRSPLATVLCRRVVGGTY